MYGPLGLVDHLHLLSRRSTLWSQAEHRWERKNIIRSRDEYESGETDRKKREEEKEQENHAHFYIPKLGIEKVVKRIRNVKNCIKFKT